MGRNHWFQGIAGNSYLLIETFAKCNDSKSCYYVRDNVVQSLENNIDVIDRKFLLSGHSYLPNDADLGIAEMALRRNNFLYTAQDYYDVIKQCRQNKKNYFTQNERKMQGYGAFLCTTNISKRCHVKSINK